MIVCGSQAQKSIQWAGYEWFLRDGKNGGPGKNGLNRFQSKRCFYTSSIKGPNNWTSTNVWLDENNKLHLKLKHSPTTGLWTCAELYTKVKFTFGTFRWFVEGPLDKLDTNIVLGLFTYGGADGTNEIDIEVARWGATDPNASNIFYTIYPHTLGVAKPVSSGTRLSLQGTYTTHQFIWSRYNVASQIQGGFIKDSSTKNLIYSYTTPNEFSSAMPIIPAPIHMNLWAFKGRPPTDGKEVEIIIHDFQYIAA